VKRAAAFLLAMFLAGCYADQGKQLAVCKIAARGLSDGDSHYLFNLWTSSYGSSIRDCMRAAGYEPAPLDDRCNANFPVADQARCYRPAGRIDRFMDWFETKIFGN
jgi:hypothetical protein